MESILEEEGGVVVAVVKVAMVEVMVEVILAKVAPKMALTVQEWQQRQQQQPGWMVAVKHFAEGTAAAGTV